MEVTGEEFETSSVGELRVTSSFADDVWHAPDGAGAYEWWYFDAVSADGRDALVIIFLAGFVFSPRYNRATVEYMNGRGGSAPRPADFPAVAVAYYRDGRLLYRSINEFAPDQFEAGASHPAWCRIGRSSFHLETTPSESRYLLKLDSPLRKGRRLEASLEWAVEEGDFSKLEETDSAPGITAHSWNLVAPRCSVSGTISVTAREDRRQIALREFRGTGYHDHNHDSRWMPATIAEWQWGRAHFDDATAVFYRYRENDNDRPVTRVFLTRGGVLSAYEALFASGPARRHHFGLRYPRELEFDAVGAEEKLTLRVRQSRVIDGSFFYLRFFGDATLALGDGVTRRAQALTEQLTPRALRWPWLWWLTAMRIGRNGRASFLP